MSAEDVIGSAGLWHATNELSEVPPSAYVRLDNCVIRSKGVIEPRQGHAEALDLGAVATASLARTPKAMGTLYSTTNQLMSNVITHAGTDVLVGSSIIASSTSAPDETVKRMAFTTGAGRTYFTTSTGVRRYDGTTVGAAGGLFCSVLSYLQTALIQFLVPDANGFLPMDSAVRYVATVTTVDAQGREIVGPASSGGIFCNPASQVSAIGGMVRSGGNLVTVTLPLAHNISIGEPVVVSPGEANFAAAQYTVKAVTGSNTFTYSDAGANVASTVAQTIQAGACHAQVIVRFKPATASTSSIVRLYRSTVATGATSIPSEDCYLVWEGNPASADVSAGFIAISDNTPEVMLGPIGYFSPSAQTRLQTNGAPPLAYDVARFGDVMFYGRTIEPHGLTLRLLATGGSAGLVNGSTFNIVVGSTTTTYTASNDYTSGFPLYNTSSVALDCQRTAIGLVNAINATGNGPCWAEYISAVDEAPGQIRLTLRTFSTTGFSVWCSRADAFNPGLPSATPRASTQENRKARVWWSKPGLPDAVPPLNFNDVGDGDEAVLRVIELREQLFIIKENSVWTVSGAYGRYAFDRLDDTIVPVGADTFQVVSGQIYGLATQGVITVSPTGVGLIGLPLATDLEPLFENNGLGSSNPIANTRTLAWGAAFETDHLYLLGLPRLTSDTKCRDVWVFSTLAKAWMRWPVSRTCCVNEPRNDVLLFGDGDAPRVVYEYPRYYDKALNATITAIALNTAGLYELTLADASFVDTGDLINGNAAPYPRGIVLAKSGDVVTVGGSNAWTGGAASVGKAYECVLEPSPIFMGAAGSEKHAQEVALLFKDANYRLFQVSVGSDMNPTQVLAKSLSAPGFGETAWGTSGWGNRSNPYNERLLVPRNASRGHYFYVRATIREASRWRLNGMSVTFDMNDAKGKR